MKSSFARHEHVDAYVMHYRLVLRLCFNIIDARTSTVGEPWAGRRTKVCNQKSSWTAARAGFWAQIKAPWHALDVLYTSCCSCLLGKETTMRMDFLSSGGFRHCAPCILGKCGNRPALLLLLSPRSALLHLSQQQRTTVAHAAAGFRPCIDIHKVLFQALAGVCIAFQPCRAYEQGKLDSVCIYGSLNILCTQRL